MSDAISNPKRWLRVLDDLPRSTGLIVAFSGGGDSTALLHALAGVGRSVRAVHVNHHLHPDAGDWAAHCRRFCTQVQVPFEVISVEVAQTGGKGLEAAARKARYQALAGRMTSGETLLTAHTRDDQAETVLLQLLRGSGIKGLAGMARQQAFAGGTLARPLLDVPRQALRDYLARHGIEWLEDPDNRNPERARVWLRQNIMPLLEQRWPAARDMLVRAAVNVGEAQAVLAVVTDADLAGAGGAAGSLSLDTLRALPAPRRRLALRRWLAEAGLPEPSRAQLEELENQALDAPPDRQVEVAWPGAVVRRYRAELFADPADTVPDPESEWTWHSNETLDLGGGLGTLALQFDSGAGAPPDWTFHVRLRRGGERIRLPGNTHHTDLKALFQDMGVPPWKRGRVPLLYRDDELVAVADWRVSDWLSQALRHHAARLVWNPCHSGDNDPS